MQPLMKIQSTNLQVQSDVSVYHEELQVLIFAHRNSILSKVMFDAFVVLVSWLSLDESTTTYNKTLDSVTFSPVNEKKFRISKKNFAHILGIPNASPFYKVTNEKILYMFNEMGYQPPLTKISEF